jgi:hypothetical protein
MGGRSNLISQDKFDPPLSTAEEGKTKTQREAAETTTGERKGGGEEAMGCQFKWDDAKRK